MLSPIVIYDACVLYPAPIRDLLIQLAPIGLYRAKWTNEIHDEWIRNLLLSRPDMKKEQLEITRSMMNDHVPECLVEKYQHLIPKIKLPDLNDRHVLAAAIKAKASIIITYDLRDFPEKELRKYKIKAIHPDEFIDQLIDLKADIICAEIKKIRTKLKNPSFTVDSYLKNLKEKHAMHNTVSKLTQYSDLL